MMIRGTGCCPAADQPGSSRRLKSWRKLGKRFLSIGGGQKTVLGVRRVKMEARNALGASILARMEPPRLRSVPSHCSLRGSLDTLIFPFLASSAPDGAILLPRLRSGRYSGPEWSRKCSRMFRTSCNQTLTTRLAFGAYYKDLNLENLSLEAPCSLCNNRQINR